MRIYIDADGCPVVKETIHLARQYKVEVIVVCDVAHQFNLEGVNVITVMQGADAVDYEIINQLESNDLVITQDYGLGALVLAKGGYAMNQNGMLYQSENIDQLLYSRYLSQKLRQSGQRLKGPKKRVKKDTEAFITSLTQFLQLKASK